MEYTTSNELKIGITLDAGIAVATIIGLAVAILAGKSDTTGLPMSTTIEGDRPKDIWWNYVEP
jgi:ribosomal protein S6E (S10)